MPCFVPEFARGIRWHIIRPRSLNGRVMGFEIAEWVNDENNGPTEGGHWIRWGYCGDFPSLCRADYIGPFPDQGMLNSPMLSTAATIPQAPEGR